MNRGSISCIWSNTQHLRRARGRVFKAIAAITLILTLQQCDTITSGVFRVVVVIMPFRSWLPRSQQCGIQTFLLDSNVCNNRHKPALHGLALLVLCWCQRTSTGHLMCHSCHIRTTRQVPELPHNTSCISWIICSIPASQLLYLSICVVSERCCCAS